MCSAKKMEEHRFFYVKTGLACANGIEILCDSIVPGCLLLLYVILKVGDTSGKAVTSVVVSAVTSVVVSALTTGFACGTISYDYDTDPVGRTQSPNFYGYMDREAFVAGVHDIE